MSPEHLRLIDETPVAEMTAGYSGTPLPRKLGIKDGSRVLVINPPDGLRPRSPFDSASDEWAQLGADPYDVVLLFCPDAAALHDGFDRAPPGTAPTG